MSEEDLLADDLELIMADKRYEVISRIVSKAVEKERTGYTVTDMLDRVFLNKWLGIPIFFF
ncbi:MAG: hypothetical protein ACTSRF_12755 [Candidatus Freyarchaeota archaeon]